MKRQISLLLVVFLLCLALVPQVGAAVESPTEEEVYQAMIAMKAQYPEGMRWTNDNFYQWNGGGMYYGGYGCAGFAYILSDAAFGTLPSRTTYGDDITYEMICVGDILRVNGDSHSVVVLEKYADYVVLAEGNFNSSIHWGRTMTREEVMAVTNYVTTRYPCIHEPEKQPQKDPTETEPGHTGDTICKKCGIVLEPGREIPITQGRCGENLTWTIDEAGTLVISGTGPMEDYAFGETPKGVRLVADKIKTVIIEEGVTSIGAYAFNGCTGLTSITIASSVASIGDIAFPNCTGLTAVELPDGLTYLGEAAFSHCTKLTQVNIPQGLSELKQWTFNDCPSLTEIRIPAGVRIIGREAFADCTNLATLTLESGVEVIQQGAFRDCVNLRKLIFPATVTEIGDSAFASCRRLNELQFEGSAPQIEDSAFYNITATVAYPREDSTWDAGTLRNYGGTLDWGNASDTETREEPEEEPDEDPIQDPTAGHTPVGTGAVLPTATEPGYTGDTVCYHCGQLLLRGKEIPAGDYAASGTCGPSALYTLDQEGTLVIAGVGEINVYRQTFYGVDRNSETSIKKVIIEEGITRIDDACFEFCDSILSVSIADSVTELGTKAFYCCDSLEEVRLPQGLTALPESCFAGCENLSDILLPESLRSIGYAAFGSCGLTSLTLPASLKEICEEAFRDCASLTSVTILSQISVLESSVFYGCESLRSAVLPEGLTSIGVMAFASCTSLTEITLPQSLTEIKGDAFHGCSALTRITIPSGVTSLGASAFIYCSGLRKVDILGPISAIEDSAFYECNALTRVQLPDSLERISQQAFYECESLSDITFPDGLKTIGAWAFDGCFALESITIPASVYLLDTAAFQGCVALSDITFLGNAPTMDNCFGWVFGTAYYPANDATWTQWVMQEAGGSVTWVGQATVQKPTILRRAGIHRYDTAFLTADQMKQTLGVEKFDTVVVASGTDFADALSGSYLAAVKNAPILLACTVDWINALTREYILENLNPGGTVYVLGGTNAISASFQVGLESFNVKRLAGDNRFLTNLKVLEEAGVGDKPILICTGLGFADSLSASAVKLPILLVYGDKLLTEQQNFLESVRGREMYIIGGTGAVSQKMESRLREYSSLERLAGSNRFETSVLLAQRFFDAPDTMVLAYAWDFPDGLCGGPLAAAMNAPLILTMQNYEQQAAAYVQSNTIRKVIVLGGESLVPQSTVNTIFSIR